MNIFAKTSTLAVASALLAGSILASATTVRAQEAPASGSAPAASSSSYEAGMPVDVELTAPVSSEIAHVGDLFYFKTVSDVTLGDVVVPAGTPGQGRLALAKRAFGTVVGELALQADTIGVNDMKIYVNVDTTVRPRARLSRRNDLVLSKGTVFRVTTIVPRRSEAQLVRLTKLPPGTVIVER